MFAVSPSYPHHPSLIRDHTVVSFISIFSFSILTSIFHFQSNSFFRQINGVLWRHKYLCALFFFLSLNSNQFNYFAGVRFSTLLKRLWQRPTFVNNCLHPVSFFPFFITLSISFPFVPPLTIPFPCDLFLLYLLFPASFSFSNSVHRSLW